MKTLTKKMLFFHAPLFELIEQKLGFSELHILAFNEILLCKTSVQYQAK